MTVIEVVNWNELYENSRTRGLKRMRWVPMRNRHDSDGYTELLDHPDGAAHFGAWCALVEVASRCDVRGTLLRDAGNPHDSRSLARMTRIPTEIWNAVLPRLAIIGWIRFLEIPQDSASSAQESAAIPQEGAP